MVEIAGYRNYICDFVLVKQIIENAVMLEKIIIDTRYSESDSESGRMSKRKVVAEQQLRAEVPIGVELVML